MACALALPGAAAALTLDEALRLAEREAPSMAARTANLQAARSAAIPAGELPDPKLALGLQNVPIEGDGGWQLDQDPMSMRMIGVMQEVPNRAKRRARVEVAEAGVDVADARRRIERLLVRRETALAWIAALAVERKLELFQRFYTENRLFERAVRARIAGGRGRAADGVLPAQEYALLGEREDVLLRSRAVAQAALRRWIGPSAGATPVGNWPQWTADAEHYRHNLDEHPELAAFAPLARQAEAEVRRAAADKRPDWSWEVDYQKRGRDYTDMVSLRLSVDLPIFPGSRQDPKIAARQARVVEVAAEREALLREHALALEEDLAEYRRLERALERLEKTLLPLAEKKVALAMADYSGGAGELVAVVDARRERVETRLRRIELTEQRALSGARLHFAYGEDAP
ncbi:TolC family protein [Azotobacter armeniacus]